MTRHDTNRRAPARRSGRAAAGLLLALLVALLLAACGGGSSKSTSTAATSTSASSTTAPAQGRGQFGARAAALRTCLKNAGITLPERKAPQQGQRPSGPFGLGGGGGGFKLPAGVSRAKLQEALKKCGGGNFAGRRFGARNPQRLAKFATCMRQNGVNLPAPNTSGKGPVFDTSGIDTTSETFKKADAKCAAELRPSGAPGAPGGGAAPPGEPPA